ncbi:cAMP-dependent protein kinase catalytic subunit alpha-like [Macrosteles quadrilineatus]|uniref:cAMP-dependent protein kinase catalytic subunit alpha-like n=1 Tax=Macrosteles quadrilineatus TaxID=74068 RepID=UPI0023E0E31B|nr:cAMP-dependent protein kinase catalytic subunit alpha-like [Macrosteles quadrilineatus]
MRLVYFSQSNFHLYFFMPLITGGDVFTHLQIFGKFDEKLSKFYAAQVVLALEFLQYCDVIHRDLKPENILIDRLGFIKLTDFGFAKKVTTRTYTFCGTIEYAAPEIILGKGHGKAVDWWSLGVLIAEMTSGRVPFTSNDELETFEQITNSEYKMPDYFSPELRKLLKGLLQKYPTRRIGNLWRGVREIKSHLWFTGVNWMDLLNRKVVPPFIPDSSERLSQVNFPNMSAVSTISISGPSGSEFDEYFKDF